MTDIHVACHVMVFPRSNTEADYDAVMDEEAILEITEVENGQAEVAVNINSPKRRVYIRFRMSDLKAAVAGFGK